jgi:dephospho-CoA kinase
MSFVIGLTGSIGMGKSTTARMFADEGCALWDSDTAVHRLYARDGAAVAGLAALFPDVIVAGAVSREALRAIIAQDETALKKIEAVVHPLVTQEQKRFIEEAASDIVILDIPLLFETGKDKDVDAVVVVTTSPEEQERRLAERGAMTAKELETLRNKQMPDSEKRQRADFVVETNTLEEARAQVRAILKQIRAELANA